MDIDDLCSCKCFNYLYFQRIFKRWLLFLWLIIVVRVLIVGNNDRIWNQQVSWSFHIANLYYFVNGTMCINCVFTLNCAIFRDDFLQKIKNVLLRFDLTVFPFPSRKWWKHNTSNTVLNTKPAIGMVCFVSSEIQFISATSYKITSSNDTSINFFYFSTLNNIECHTII